MRRNRLGKEDWVDIKWKPGKIAHNYQKDGVVGFLSYRWLYASRQIKDKITHFLFMSNSYTIVSPSTQMAKMTVMDFPNIPKQFHIKSSKKSLQKLRREMAEEILQASGIFLDIIWLCLPFLIHLITYPHIQCINVCVCMCVCVFSVCFKGWLLLLLWKREPAQYCCWSYLGKSDV